MNDARRRTIRRDGAARRGRSAWRRATRFGFVALGGLGVLGVVAALLGPAVAAQPRDPLASETLVAPAELCRDGQMVTWDGVSTHVFGHRTYRNIVGTDCADVIVGTAGDDYIVGNKGDDVIYALGGDDWVTAGFGADELYGQGGDDLLDGGYGSDLLVGDLGNDALVELAWPDFIDDTLDGGPGNDLLVSGEGDDRIYGGDGHDFAWDEQGANLILMGAGNDAVHVVDSYVTNTVYGEAGDDCFSHAVAALNNVAQVFDGGLGDDWGYLDPNDVGSSVEHAEGPVLGPVGSWLSGGGCSIADSDWPYVAMDGTQVWWPF